MQGAFKEPLVVVDAVAAKVGLHLGDVSVQAEAGHGSVALGDVLAQKAVAVLGVKRLGQLLDVLALIAVLGEGDLVLAQNELLISCVDGGGELLDLVAGVVDVELAPDIVARAVQDTRQRVAQDAAAGVAHVHGAGGIGGDKLHHQLFAAALVHAAVVCALGIDAGEHVGIPAGREAEVDEAGAGHLDRRKPASVQIQVLRKRLGDFARGHVQGARAGHGVVCGVVAVLGVLRDLHRAAEHSALGELSLRGRFRAGVVQKGVDAVLRVLDHVSHCFCLLFLVLLRSAGSGSGWQRRAPCRARSRSPPGRRAR